MLIKDEAQLKADAFFKNVDTDNQRIADSLHQYDGSVLLGKENDPTNELHRMGKFLMPVEFIKKLKQLSRDILVEIHPTKPHMYVVYDTRRNEKKYVSAFENAPVPERTIMDTKTTLDVDPESLSPSWRPGKHNVVKPNANGIIEVDDTVARPGLKSYTNPWHVVKMGYRTILIRLLYDQLCTKSQIELYFDNDNTPEWAAKTGSQSIANARF